MHSRKFDRFLMRDGQPHVWITDEGWITYNDGATWLKDGSDPQTLMFLRPVESPEAGVPTQFVPAGLIVFAIDHPLQALNLWREIWWAQLPPSESTMKVVKLDDTPRTWEFAEPPDGTNPRWN